MSESAKNFTYKGWSYFVGRGWVHRVPMNTPRCDELNNTQLQLVALFDAPAQPCFVPRMFDPALMASQLPQDACFLSIREWMDHKNSHHIYYLTPNGCQGLIMGLA